MPSRTAYKLTAVTAVLALGLAACNGGDGGDTTDGDGGEAFQFGYVLPETGQLAFLGPPQISAMDFAIQEINDAGGILGEEVPDPIPGDEAGDAAQANEAANNLVGEGVNAVVGAAASGMTQAIYDTITGAEIVECSGSNTAPDLSDINDGGYYFRTAPSDLMSGPILARQIINDGHLDVAVISRADDYGDGYAGAVAEELENLGADIVYQDSYDPEASNFDSVVNGALGEDPDAIALIAFEEGVQVLSGLLENGAEGDQLYITDGMNDPDLGGSIDEDDPEIISGATGVAPGADNPSFQSDLQDFAPDLDVYQFSEQVFDCVTAIALAAEAAGSVVPADYVSEMQGVTQDGTPCATFAECRDLLEEGEDIDYQGVSGDIRWADNGDPTTASFQIFHFGDDGYETLEYETFDPEENEDAPEAEDDEDDEE